MWERLAPLEKALNRLRLAEWVATGLLATYLPALLGPLAMIWASISGLGGVHVAVVGIAAIGGSLLAANQIAVAQIRNPRWLPRFMRLSPEYLSSRIYVGRVCADFRDLNDQTIRITVYCVNATGRQLGPGPTSGVLKCYFGSDNNAETLPATAISQGIAVTPSGREFSLVIDQRLTGEAAARCSTELSNGNGIRFDFSDLHITALVLDGHLPPIRLPLWPGIITKHAPHAVEITKSDHASALINASQ